MGSVAITFRVMPEDPSTDLEAVKSRVRETLGPAVRDLKVEPVAFGLNAILAIAVRGDSEGGTEALEQALASIPGVASVDVIDVTLV